MIRSFFPHGLWNATALLMPLTFIPLLVNAQDKGYFTDARDGMNYHWAKIGSQTWMTGNLDYKIPGGSWAYNNDSVSEMNFGRLYTWKAAQSACPKGWHLPSDKEWGVLIKSLGGPDEAGMRLQVMDTVRHAQSVPGKPPLGVISSLLGGIRHADGSFSGQNSWGGCWSSGKINDTVASNVLFVHGTKSIGPSSNDKKAGFSVRCIKGK